MCAFFVSAWPRKCPIFLSAPAAGCPEYDAGSARTPPAANPHLGYSWLPMNIHWLTLGNPISVMINSVSSGDLISFDSQDIKFEGL